MLATIALILAPLTANALEDGLLVRYTVDRDGDGQAETEVCHIGYQPWELGDNLALYPRALSMRYPDGATPCAEIAPGERWGVEFHGQVRFDRGGRWGGGAAPVDILVDVNDGARVLLYNLHDGSVLCSLDFWADVPEYDNYHSSDANGLTDVCLEQLRTGQLYGIEIDFYHQSPTPVQSHLFWRAYLAVYFQGLSRDTEVQFFHEPVTRDVNYELESLGVWTWPVGDETAIRVWSALTADGPVDQDVYESKVQGCLLQ